MGSEMCIRDRAVITLDVLDGILAAVGLALIMVLVCVSRPQSAVLGRVAGLPGFHNVAHFHEAALVPGVVVYRFGAALWFFNAPYFRRQVLDLAAANPDARSIIVDGAPFNGIDVTGAETLLSTTRDLRARNTTLALANVRTEVCELITRISAAAGGDGPRIYPSLETAVDALASASSRHGD